MKKYSLKKRVSQKAQQQSSRIPKVDDHFKLVKGILSHLKGKKTSVQLQHEAKELWVDKYFNKVKGIKRTRL